MSADVPPPLPPHSDVDRAAPPTTPTLDTAHEPPHAVAVPATPTAAPVTLEPAPQAAPPTAVPVTHDSSTLDQPAPRGLVTVPGYEILEELGRGGMGVVYKARQIRANRVVALKMILHQAHASLHEKVRFQIEAEAIASLQHPNIVQLHEAGEHAGLPFFSLEFCDGGSLAQRLKQGLPSPKESATVVETLARAMPRRPPARRGPPRPEAGECASGGK